MKKIISVLLAVTLMLSVFYGCKSQKKDNTVLKIGGLKGPTSLGMLKLMEDESFDFTVAGSADELTPKFINGELDVLAVPVNLGAVLYNKTGGKIKMLAVNTLGVVSIVENGNDISEIKDLKGKTVYATAKGSVPEYALRYILKENGIDPDKDITLEWKNEPSEIVALMASGKHIIAMMPEPYITVAERKIENLRAVIDLTKEWDKLNTDSRFITAGLFIGSSVLEEHPEKVKSLTEKYMLSVSFVNSDKAEAAKLSEKYGIINADVAQKAIPNCNIVYIKGEEMKAAADGFLKKVYDLNPKAVGGKLPDENFYYIEK